MTFTSNISSSFLISVDSAFKEVHVFLQKQAHRPFLHRYLKRDEIQRDVAACDTALTDALSMFEVRPSLSLHHHQHILITFTR